ncbi:MAG: hypothetical protein NTY36_10115 [Deltaproteobacteria bacterium]|nr:hypothetical protein [Deltaproteobacteria bacterium]
MNTQKNLSLLLLLGLIACGCAGVSEPSPSDEVKAFFMAANDANFLGLTCMSPQSKDLSAYSSFMGVKYPPTDSVEVLSGPPSRPYQAFAVLQGSASSSPIATPGLLAQLTTKAKAMGADAIILCPQPGGPEQTGAVRPAKVEAVVIKYRWENPQEKQGSP